MKKVSRFLPLLGLCALLSISSCKKDEAEPQLPAATMEGKNTFGALVNGKVWVPKGRPNFYQSNLSVVYEPGYQGGELSIKAYRVTDNTDDYMFIYMSQLDHEGTYDLNNPQIGTATFWSSCVYERDADVYRKGKLEITKLDLAKGIIAGKFEFTLTKPGCETIRVTEGRFDKKLF